MRFRSMLVGLVGFILGGVTLASVQAVASVNHSAVSLVGNSAVAVVSKSAVYAPVEEKHAEYVCQKPVIGPVDGGMGVVSYITHARFCVPPDPEYAGMAPECGEIQTPSDPTGAATAANLIRTVVISAFATANGYRY